MPRPTLKQIHLANQGKVSNKWSSYLAYYDALFGRLREASIRMLEIGVQNGGSLETWGHYFENATAIVGCDIDEKCRNLRFERPNTRVFVGDANVPETSAAILAHVPEFDIVIDDGSHISDDMIRSFLLYFPRVVPGGIYVVEDTHALYWNGYGGGLLNERSAYAFFKKLVDVINFRFWERRGVGLGPWLHTFFPDGQVPAFIAEGWIDAIEFRNSIITVRKARAPGHDKLGQRWITGNTADVFDFASDAKVKAADNGGTAR